MKRRYVELDDGTIADAPVSEQDVEDEADLQDYLYERWQAMEADK